MGGSLAEAPATRERIEALCRQIPPARGHGALLSAINGLWPGVDFRPALSRGGWYRIGGVVKADGSRVADDLNAWAEDAWSDCGEDGAALAEQYGGAGLQATRVDGRTHYFVSSYGPGAADFLQLEIEELQEVTDRPLICTDSPPAELQELVDPACHHRAEPQPVGAPRYALRRLTDIGGFSQRLQSQRALTAPIVRMLQEWDAASAGRTGRFCDFWVLALSENLDRYRQPRLGAKPVAAPPAGMPSFAAAGKSGLELGAALHDFDRRAGYSFAWYFSMLAGLAVPKSIPAAAWRDWEAGLRYLPDRDAEVLQGWIVQPFAA